MELDAFIGPGYRGASNDHTSLRTMCLQRLLVRVPPRLLGQLPIKYSHTTMKGIGYELLHLLSTRVDVLNIVS